MATFSHRDEAHPFPDLIQGIRARAHVCVTSDDRNPDAALSVEPDRRSRPFKADLATGTGFNQSARAT